MSARITHLHAVAPCAPDQAELGDLGLTATIFAVGLFPIVCDLAGVGRWGGASLGLGALGALLSGRELAGWARRALSGRERSSRPPGPGRCTVGPPRGGDAARPGPRPAILRARRGA